jgi:multiple sugar transport system permease protein
MSTRILDRRKLLILLLIIVCIIITIFPLYYLMITSVKTRSDLFARPPKFYSTEPSFEAYEEIIDKKFYTFFGNSFIVALAATAIALIIGMLGSFAISRWKFRGKEGLFFFSMLGRMFPPATTIIPIYMMTRFVGLLDTKVSLILVYTSFLLPLIVLIMRDFFEKIPVEIMESAYIDGCSHLQVFSRIAVPMSGNGILAAAILAFVEAWNEFLFALVLTSIKAKTAPVLLANYIENEGSLQWGILAALGIWTILPTLLIMIVLNRFLVTGLTMGAVKG